jgi:hypothetical protein
LCPGERLRDVADPKTWLLKCAGVRHPLRPTCLRVWPLRLSVDRARAR